MAEMVIYVRGTRAEVRKAIVNAASAASGRSHEGREAAAALQVRIGMTALAYIRDAFVVKSKGGADASGLKWPPLSPKTIAYSRRHPGVPDKKTRAAFRPSWNLTDKQREKWWDNYRKALARFKGDKEKAAALAWFIAKGEGAKTLLEKYGSTSVLILRDLGLLLNSLSPGVTPGDVENQVFRIGPGEVIIGTNRKHAASHHYGIPGKLPQRKLWPDPEDWPSAWWQGIAEQAKQGYVEILLSFLRKI